MAEEKDLTRELKFSSPPVTQVTLSLFFEPVLEMTAASVLPILNQWLSSYPIIDESLPATPWSSDASKKMRQATNSGAHWPMALTTVASEDTTQIVRVQEDRFEVEWQYDPELGNEYPGFRGLTEELWARFNDFSNQIHEDTGGTFRIRRADATYTNIVEVPIAQYSIGVLSQWNSDYLNVDVVANTHLGIHLRNVHDPAPEHIKTFIDAHSDVDASSTSLVIDARCDVVEEADPYDCLVLAHDVVLTSFVRLTSDDMRAGWGAKQ